KTHSAMMMGRLELPGSRRGSLRNLGNRAALYLFHHIASNHLKEFLLLHCHLPWFRVEDTQRSNWETIRPAQWNAGIEPQTELFNKRVVRETWISRQVAYD